MVEILSNRLIPDELLRSPGITLCDRRNRDDAVSRTRRSPSAVKHDAKERRLVAAAEERAVQALRAWDAADEPAVRREYVHRLARRNIHAALLIDGRAVAALTTLQFAELALIGQGAVRLHVEREYHCAVRDVERLLVGAQDYTVGERNILPILRDHAFRVGVEHSAAGGAGDGEVDATARVGHQIVHDAAYAFERLAVERVRQHLPLRFQLFDGRTEPAFGDEQCTILAARDRAAGVRVAVDDLGEPRRRIELHDVARVVVCKQQRTDGKTEGASVT